MTFLLKTSLYAKTKNSFKTGKCLVNYDILLQRVAFSLFFFSFEGLSQQSTTKKVRNAVIKDHHPQIAESQRTMHFA